jgi:hypothetical protein
MLLIFGQGKYGKVDHVPNLFYVVTEFFHLYYVPLLPLRSYLVLDGSRPGAPTTTARISLSLKSMLVGWLRAAFVLAVVGGVIGGVIALVEYLSAGHGGRLETVLIPWVIAVAGVVLYWLSRRATRAGLERALALGDQVGLPAEYIEEHFEQLHSYRDTLE